MKFPIEIPHFIWMRVGFGFFRSNFEKCEKWMSAVRVFYFYGLIENEPEECVILEIFKRLSVDFYYYPVFLFVCFFFHILFCIWITYCVTKWISYFEKSSNHVVYFFADKEVQIAEEACTIQNFNQQTLPFITLVSK